MKPIAIVQHEDHVPPGLIDRVMTERGIEHRIVDATGDPVWPATEDLGGLVVMGGTMNVDQTDEYPFLKQSRDLMASSIETGVPTLGVCLGSQMMARVLGAEVRQAEFRNARFSPLDLTNEGKTDPLVAPFEGIEVLQFHEDTFDFPPGVIRLATSRASGLGQAFRYGDRAYAIQFHFEVDAEIVRSWTERIGAEAMTERWNAPDGGSELLERERYRAQAGAGRRLVEGFIDLLR